MTPKEEAESIVFNMYYYLLESDDRQIRAKELAFIFCKKHIAELKTLPVEAICGMHIDYWKMVITEIKAL